VRYGFHYEMRYDVRWNAGGLKTNTHLLSEDESLTSQYLMLVQMMREFELEKIETED